MKGFADFAFISLTKRVLVLCFHGGSRIFQTFYGVFQT